MGRVQSVEADTAGLPTAIPLVCSAFVNPTGGYPNRVTVLVFDNFPASYTRLITCSNGLAFTTISDGVRTGECDNSDAHLLIQEHVMQPGDPDPGTFSFSIKNGGIEQNGTKTLIAVELSNGTPQYIATGAATFGSATINHGTANVSGTNMYALAAASITGAVTSGTSYSGLFGVAYAAQRGQLGEGLVSSPTATTTVTLPGTVDGRGMLVVWNEIPTPNPVTTEPIVNTAAVRRASSW